MCFNGNVRCTFTCTNRNTESGLNITVFDNDWNRLPFGREAHPADSAEILKPVHFAAMKQFAEKIAAELSARFVRIDFYDVDDRLYFGEITFYPAAGLEPFSPEEWDKKLGEWITL